MIWTIQLTQPTQPKVITTIFGIFTKLSPDGPQMRPRGTQNDSQNQKNMSLAPKMVPSWFQEGVSSMLPTPFGGFLGPLGVPKIDQKSILGPKRGARKRFFIDFSREQRFSHFWAWFFIDFWWFFDQKIDAFFQSRAQFFQHGDGLNLCTGAVF